MSNVTTIVFSGGAAEWAPAIVREFRGGAVQIAHVAVEDHVAYAQHSRRHLLHVPLAIDGSLRGGGRVSFTPGDRERSGRTGRGRITGLQIGFEDWFLEEACEQSVRETLSVADAADARSMVMAETIAALSGPSLHDRLAYETMLLALARNLGRTYGQAPKRRDDGWLHPRALSRVIERLRSEPAGSIPLHALASEAGLGVSAFIRAFRGSAGVTPAAFALRMRLDDASQMLRHTDLSVAGIAALCGFSSASHFVSAFRAHRGETPARWRKHAAGPDLP